MNASCTASRSSSTRSASMLASAASSEASSPASSSLSGSMGRTRSFWCSRRIPFAPFPKVSFRSKILGAILEGQVDLQEVDEQRVDLVLDEQPAEAGEGAGGGDELRRQIGQRRDALADGFEDHGRAPSRGRVEHGLCHGGPPSRKCPL